MENQGNTPEIESKKTGDFVTVGCKLPHGLWMEVAEDKKPVIKMLAAGCNSSRVFGGFGLTENVPKDFWEKWLDTHKDLKFVKDGLIWAYKSRGGAERKALEEAEKRHGAEPLDPNKLPPKIEKGELE